MENQKQLPQTLEELNVKYFKLMNGESIISYTHELDSDLVVGLEEPMKISIDNEDQSYLLTPWIPFSDGRVHVLDAINIVIESPVDTQMKAQYMKIVLDGIDPDIDDTTGTLH